MSKYIPNFIKSSSREYVGKTRTYYANHEYPKLTIDAPYLIAKKGRRRLIQYDMEVLTPRDGFYEPHPITIKVRKLQFKVFCWWITIEEGRIKRDTNEVIMEDFRGYRYWYDWSEIHESLDEKQFSIE